MAARIVRGTLVGVIDGPRMILEVRGEERQYDLGVEVSLDWVGQHMDESVLVKVEGGRITEIA